MVFTDFTKEGSHKIIIRSGEALSSYAPPPWELELDENNIPLKIIDGKYYAIFTYDSDNKNLIKQTLYDISTEKIVTTYNYEYDSNFGILSKVDLPLWFYAYKAYSARESRYTYNRIYFNYYNNLIKETISNENGSKYDEFNSDYWYNDWHAPVLMSGDTPGRISLSITY